jgi:tRNA(His) guanylyltransferase
MAGSMYAYVRNFEMPDPVMPNTFMVVRIDGKGFHKFSEAHGFVKPNDGRALELMNQAARHVVNDLRPDVVLAFGESDEYSFLLRRSCSLYKRRCSKLTTHIVSLFTSAYVFYWSHYMTGTQLLRPPSFDGRLIAYPSEKEIRDYFSWRQADTHINNLYNTTFWALVQQGSKTEREAHEQLQGTVSADKNEILYGTFGVNYDKLPAMYRKGTTLVWHRAGTNAKPTLRTLHVDIIGRGFWAETGKETDFEAMPEEDAIADEPWLQAGRTSNWNGLGKIALSA